MIECVAKHSKVTPITGFMERLFKVWHPYFIKPDIAHHKPGRQKDAQDEPCELGCPLHDCVISVAVVIIV